MTKASKIAAVLIALATITAVLACAQALPRSPYSYFISYVEEDYQYYQFKITYMSDQTKYTPSLSFFDSSYTYWDLSRFIPYQHDETEYGNDSVLMWQFYVEPEEMMWFVLGVGDDTTLTDTTAIADPFASYMIVRDPGYPSELGFEALLTQDELTQLLYLLHESLNWANVDGVDHVARYRRMHMPRP